MMFTGASHAMADNVKTTDRGVEIYVADASSASAGVVRLSVITDNIVRVEAVPGDSLPAPRASLMVVPQEPCGRFDCTERGVRLISSFAFVSPPIKSLVPRSSFEKLLTALVTLRFITTTAMIIAAIIAIIITHGITVFMCSIITPHFKIRAFVTKP